MAERITHVLFLCTGNTARSILAEGILRRDGAGRFVAHSAGSQPKGVVNPWALRILAAQGYPADDFRSKSWDEFSGVDAPGMDFIITVCDNAAGEVCPIWPGRPMAAHWGVADPAAVAGSDADKERAFAAAFGFLKQRIDAFLALPMAESDATALAEKVRAIGKLAGASAKAT